MEDDDGGQVQETAQPDSYMAVVFPQQPEALYTVQTEYAGGLRSNPGRPTPLIIK